MNRRSPARCHLSLGQGGGLDWKRNGQRWLCWLHLGVVCVLPVLPLQPALAQDLAQDLAPNSTQSTATNWDKADRFFQRGILYFQRNDLTQATENWQQALALYQQRNDAQGQLKSLEGLGLVHQRQNQLDRALQTFEAAKVLAEDIGDRPRLANTLGNLGNLRQRQGQYQLASQQYGDALDIYRALGDRRREGLLLTNLANLQAALGQYSNAQLLFQQSLSIAQQEQDPQGKLSALNSLGLVQASQGRYLQAENAYYQALQLSRSLGDARPNPETEATLLYNLGSLDHAQERFTKAIGYYQQGLDLAPTTSTITPTLQSNLALIQAELGQTAEAIASLQSSIQQLQTSGNPVQTALQQGNLGYVHWRAGQLPQAEAALKAAIAQREAIWNSLATSSGPTDNRQTDLDQISLFDTQLHPYSLLQQVLVAQGKPEEALLVAEQSRARAFAALVARQFGRDATPTVTPKLDELRQLARDRQATLVEYAVIPDETFIAQGKLKGDAKAIYIWVIQPSGDIHFRNVDLTPLREQGITLQQLIRAARCFDSNRMCKRLLKPHRTAQESALSRGASPDAPEQTRSENGFQFNPAANPSGAERQPAPLPHSTHQRFSSLEQFHQLLIDPISDLLPQSPQESVVLIPHDSLFLLPFSALQDRSGEFLIERHAISYAPSLQVLKLMAPPQSQQRWRNSLLVGNPTMPTFQRSSNSSPQALAPLPGAEAEVKAIAKEMQAKPLLGASATEKAVTERLTQASWIHLATHGLLDYGTTPSAQASNPWLNGQQGQPTAQHWGKIPGAIALAPGQNSQDPNNDGLLTANEIIQLNVQAELVVLSACDTGRGEITGDGVVGLSRAWLGAGAKGVLVSLWAVPDDATAMLMEQFYQQLNSGHSQAESLRLAMLATQKEYPNPRQWAAFSLMGAPQAPETSL